MTGLILGKLAECLRMAAENKTILFLAANPSDTTRLMLGAEVTAIRAGLAQSTYRDRFDFEQVWATTPQAMQSAILKVRPQIVHFSGHGGGQDGLLLENGSGQSKPVTAQALSGLFELFADCVECVMLNACYSEVQGRAIAQHIPFTIGMNQAIGDRAATQFSVGFYTALGEGETIPFAFKYGRSCISMDGLPDGAIPTFTRSSGMMVGGLADAGGSLLNRVTAKPKQSSGDSRKAVVISPLDTPPPQNQHRQPMADLPAITPEDILQDSQDGAVELDSRFYVRSLKEERACEAIQQPGALLRIKSPHGMGKSSLTIRVLKQCESYAYRTVTLDFKQTNSRFFQDLDKFAQWFCASVGKSVGVRVKTDEYWDDIFGPNDNCTDYFERYLLTGEPLVLALENFDRLFDYPDIEGDFCGLLRGWHEKAKRDKRWEQLCLIIVYSQESYEPKDINQSPFNVGFLVELGPWTLEEVTELAARYGLDLTLPDLSALLNLTGGHPQLVRLALEPLALGEMSLDEIESTAATESGIFRAHLLDRLRYLEQRPELKAAMQKIVEAKGPVRVKSQDAFKLDSMGLISRRNNDVLPLCEVYQAYFQERLAE